MYRIITLKKNKLYNIAYSPTLIYSQALTKADSYDCEIKINRCTYLSDINNHIIFENDIIEDENGEEFIVKYDYGWKLEPNKKSINELDKKCKITKNIYVQIKNYVI